AFAVSSALSHLPSAVAPKRYPLWISTIGWRSAAIARSQIRKAHSSAPGIIENARLSILFRFLAGHPHHGRFVFRVEADCHSLGAAAQISVIRFPSLVVNN